MSWFEKLKAPKIKPKAPSVGQTSGGEASAASVPEQLWIKCTQCGEILQAVTLKANDHVCLQCGFHFRISAWQRIESMTSSFEEWDGHLSSGDPLSFVDVKPYLQRIKQARETTRSQDAFITGVGVLKSRQVEGRAGLSFGLGVFEFRFMGGSMGSVVGEKICRLFEMALERRLPVVIVCSSGGARMQEGILSLMQMARTSALVGLMKKEGLGFVTILSDPTTGGVAASFAMQGDVILAEPGALIGFAGPRVIGQTMRQDLPPGFQRSEFLLKHGMIDRIVSRRDLCAELGVILGHLAQAPVADMQTAAKKKAVSSIASEKIPKSTKTKGRSKAK